MKNITSIIKKLRRTSFDISKAIKVCELTANEGKRGKAVYRSGHDYYFIYWWENGDRSTKQISYDEAVDFMLRCGFRYC